MQLCTETESKHSQKADKAIQQCDFTSPESKKNWGLYSAWVFFCFHVIFLVIYFLLYLTEVYTHDGLKL